MCLVEERVRGGGTPTIDEGTGALPRAPLAVRASVLGRRLEAALAEAYRRQQPLSLARMELDGFAELRARLGDAAADALRCEVADLLRDRVRRADLFAPHGGAGFVAVFGEVTLPIAVRVARRLLQALRGAPPCAAGEPLALTLSVGVASTDRRRLSAEGLLEGAERALARALWRGGNRIRACRFPSRDPPRGPARTA